MHLPYALCLNLHLLHAYVLISSLHQPHTLIPTSWFLHLLYTMCCITLYCKCFGLAIGEDVYDLQLPLVSRIPDIDVMVGSHAICHHWFSLLSFVYISSSLCPMYYDFACPALHHPPPSLFSSWCFSPFLYLYPVVLNSEVLAHAGAVYPLPRSLVKPPLHTRRIITHSTVFRQTNY